MILRCPSGTTWTSCGSGWVLTGSQCWCLGGRAGLLEGSHACQRAQRSSRRLCCTGHAPCGCQPLLHTPAAQVLVGALAAAAAVLTCFVFSKDLVVFLEAPVAAQVSTAGARPRWACSGGSRADSQLQQ